MECAEERKSGQLDRVRVVELFGALSCSFNVLLDPLRKNVGFEILWCIRHSSPLDSRSQRLGAQFRLFVVCFYDELVVAFLRDALQSLELAAVGLNEIVRQPCFVVVPQKW